MSDDEILASIRKNNLKDSTVTIVLVGKDTEKRKWVDWENKKVIMAFCLEVQQ